MKELSSNKGGGDGGVIFSAAPPPLSDDPSPQSPEEQQYYEKSSAEVPSSPVHADLQYLHRSLQKVITTLYALTYYEVYCSVLACCLRADH